MQELIVPRLPDEGFIDVERTQIAGCSGRVIEFLDVIGAIVEQGGGPV
jgi:hypothetical protein